MLCKEIKIGTIYSDIVENNMYVLLLDNENTLVFLRQFLRQTK